MENQDIWADKQLMQSLLKRKSSIEDLLKEYNEIDKNYEDLKVILELYQETGEEIEGIEGKINEINEEINKFELKLLLKEENDANNAILILHAGTGGTDAQDWTEMLARMYIRWCEKRGFKIKVIEISFV